MIDVGVDAMHGELKPVGGGDPIPLRKTRLLVGRSAHCDVVLPYRQVSADHCELVMQGPYWYVRDLRSTNGTKVNGRRVANAEEILQPSDILSVAHYQYEIHYTPGA